ncbi:hypothetical protein LDENG_00219500 [Lucifuga dentata]|nr:hypothetical protein LDENG_00219500 [Lucifuga dentata]
MHFINFKVDLDVLGVKNVFQTKDMEFVNVSVPWMPERFAMIPQLVEKQLKTGSGSSSRHQDSSLPPYRQTSGVISAPTACRFSASLGITCQRASLGRGPCPGPGIRCPSVNRRTWNRILELSIIRTICGIRPSTLVNTFIEDNESIDNEDLVAWVTTGFLHIPHSEDIPNTVTVGNGGGVILRSHNYFVEDPSIHSPDGVYFEPGRKQSCDTNRMACWAQESCGPEFQPISYHGFEGITNRGC